MVNYIRPTRQQEINAYSNMANRIKNNKSYANCIIGKTWLRDHSKFYEWYRSNYYELPDGEKINIDKDIQVPDNRIYSEDTCLLVPESVNSFFVGIRGKRDTDLPVGVSLNKKTEKYIAGISYNGATKRLGTYDTPAQAHEAWRKVKIEQLDALIEKYNDIVPSEVTEAMAQWRDII